MPKDLQVVYDPSFDKLCTAHQNGNICANCKTLVTCLNGKAYPQLCDSGHFCHKNKVCYPGKPRECVCKKNDVFYQDKYDEEAFFICDNSGKTHLHHCLDGYIFNEEALRCRSASGLPSCITPGVFALPENCSRYYACISTRDGWLQHEFSCPKLHHHRRRLMYDEVTGKCENPCHWKSPNFTCSKEGRFADPVNCQRFYVCTRDVTDSSEDGFREVLRQCPTGFQWRETPGDKLGHCTPLLSGKCPPPMVTKCHIPKDMCH